MRLSCFILSLLLLTGALYGQASWETFGQNRVQYRTFHWKYYDSTHFRAFYYDYGKNNAQFNLHVAEQELSNIVYLMGGRLNKKLNIILYNSFGDYRQTNLGRKSDELNVANGGKLDIAGDCIPVYFDGDHNHLKNQIRKGIANVIKDNMLFGDNLKDVVKNAVQMNLPEWYTLGYVHFIAEEWTGDKKDEIGNLLVQAKGKSFIDLAAEHPALYGQSFWNFVADRYGENYISNLLYLTRYRKSVSHAIEMVFNKPEKELLKEWALYYQVQSITDTGADSTAGRHLLTSIHGKKLAQYANILASPSGREIAYVEKKDGRFRILIQDVTYHKTYTIIEGGLRSVADMADPDYPMLCWSPSGNKMAALYQQKNVLNLRIFTTGKRIMEKRSIPARKVDRITGMCFMGDENTMAVTAIRKGQSDLFRLQIRNNQFEYITQDAYDEKDPQYIENGVQNGLLFLSNRDNRYLSQHNPAVSFQHPFNLFLYQPHMGNNITPLSQNSGMIRYPIQWGEEQFSYLEDRNGKLTRNIVQIEKRGQEGDTFTVHKAAPAPFTILTQHYIMKAAQVTEVTRQQQNYLIWQTPLDTLKQEELRYWAEHPDTGNTALLQAEREQPRAPYLTPFDADPDSTQLLDEIFTNAQKKFGRFQTFSSGTGNEKARAYRTTFYTDYIQTTLDNTLLFTRYQPLSSSFNNVTLSGFITSTLTDVMEDYKLTGGARLGIDFKSFDYFLRFANYRRRVDWGLLYFHSSSMDQTIAPTPYYSPYLVTGKSATEYFIGNATYPLDMQRSFRLQLGMRYDRIRYLAQDQYSIEIPTAKQYWAISHAEYVFDNTINPMLNIWKGTRAKLFAEYQYRMNEDRKGFFNFGYDARYYKPIYKNLIWASRFAGAHSMGNAKVLYYLGGVDNPLFARFDKNTVVNAGTDYAFQSLATNLRGYKQGARNGNSFMVLNEEIRLPVYNTFFKRPVKSGFVRNFQVIAFADAGITIKGIFPTSDNIINQVKIQDPQSNVAVYLDECSALGYGFGLRSRFLGYFIRSDFAWHPGGGRKPMLHLSLATDF